MYYQRWDDSTKNIWIKVFLKKNYTLSMKTLYVKLEIKLGKKN